MGRSSVLHHFLLSVLILSLLQISANAAMKSYIVYLGAQPHGLNPTSVELDAVTNSHYNLLGSVLGSNERAQEAIFYSYNQHINGFAAVLDEEEASEISSPLCLEDPNVVSVIPNTEYQLHTTRSWEFLGLEDENGKTSHDSLWEKAQFGENIIIGNLDSGVWPESESFSDEGYGEIPSKWRGTCEFDTKDKVGCNRKLIGARYFNKGFKANINSTIEVPKTPRDEDGHGSHTLSTAGGNFVPNASVFGFGNGTAKGGSPKARVASYKVCWGVCAAADILAGFEAAIHDGVDVVSVSLGGNHSIEFYKDPIAVGSFHAVQNGIVVVSSAGNSGPVPGSVGNVAPWMLTVGASTIDREFTSKVTLGNNKHLKGTSLSPEGLRPARMFYPMISGADANNSTSTSDKARLCLPGSLDPKKVKGKILVCVRGENARTEKGEIAAVAGAVGMILVNNQEGGDETLADPHVLPAIQC